MIWAEEVPKIDYQDLNGKSTLVEVLVGKLGRSSSPTPPPDSWAFDPQNEVAIYNIIMQPGAQWTLPAASKGINRTLYYYEGSGLKVDNTIIPPYHGADATDSMDILLQNGDEPSKVLVLQGRPIQEPVVQHGPFVMNTRDEIRQAFDDYQRTQFGGWPWPKYDQVHPRDTGRFALHSDGRQEIPG